jgi:hypothetical protein
MTQVEAIAHDEQVITQLDLEQYVQWQASAVAQFDGANYSLQSITQGFLSSGDNANTPVLNQTNVSASLNVSPERSRGANSQASPEREAIKHTLIGSPKAVNSTIRVLHQLKYASISDWSPLVPTGNIGEVMSILIRSILVQ